ncbi:MAG TPA: hypothetical protein VNW97_09180 [Candidatus Saccharimonadales bacterium]|jgi:hypothetical protein|nr:hypothetical protein [Candidatus Saccharimonadales bacterium]
MSTESTPRPEGHWIRDTVRLHWLGILIGILGIVIGIVGIVVAVAVTDQDTQYIADWPNHLDDIRKLIDRSERGDELLILVESIGYAHYSNPKDYDEYLSQLISKSAAPLDRRIPVKVLFLREEIFVSNLRVQFEQYRDKKNFKDLQQDKTFKTYVDHYIQKGWIKAPGPSSYKQLMEDLFTVSDKFCGQLKSNGVEMYAITSPQQISTTASDGSRAVLLSGEPLFFWMRFNEHKQKRNEVIFAFPKFSYGTKGHAFKSHDPKLLDELKQHFINEWDASKNSPSALSIKGNQCYLKSVDELVELAQR